MDNIRYVNQCEYCDFLNDLNEDKCIICEAPLSHNIIKDEKKCIEMEEICDDKRNEKEDEKLNDSNMKSELKEDNLENERKCEYCDSDINESDVKCSICDMNTGYEKRTLSENAWKCPSCTYINDLENLCCSACFTFRPVESLNKYNELSILIDTDEICKEKWQCRHCKTENCFDSYMCSKCRTYAPFFRKWRCLKCSFFNDEMREICEMCKENCKRLPLVDEFKKGKDDKSRSRKLSDSDNSGDNWFCPSFSECVYCKAQLKNTNNCFCERCDLKKWYCNNKFCGTINYLNTHYCSKCEVKKGSNITSKNKVDVFNGKHFEMMTQCFSCGELNNGAKCHNAKCNNYGLISLSGIMEICKNWIPNIRNPFK